MGRPRARARTIAAALLASLAKKSSSACARWTLPPRTQPSPCALLLRAALDHQALVLAVNAPLVLCCRVQVRQVLRVGVGEQRAAAILTRLRRACRQARGQREARAGGEEEAGAETGMRPSRASSENPAPGAVDCKERYKLRRATALPGTRTGGRGAARLTDTANQRAYLLFAVLRLSRFGVPSDFRGGPRWPVQNRGSMFFHDARRASRVKRVGCLMIVVLGPCSARQLASSAAVRLGAG